MLCFQQTFPQIFLYTEHFKYLEIGQAKFGYGGLVFGLNRFPLLPQLPHKLMIAE
jgi:hypothetical protein